MIKKNLKDKQFLLVLLLSFLFIVIFSYFSIRRYKTLNSHYYDLGIMSQVVFNTSQGRFLEMTNQDLEKNVSRFAIHFDPILAIFAPLYKIYPQPEVLLISQAIILGLGALAVFLIAKKIIKNKLISLIFSLSYLFYFAVQRAAIFDFHPVVLSTTFFLFALLFNLFENYKAYFVFILLSLLTKEHIGLVVFLLGLYQFFIEKKRRVGFFTSILGLVFFISTIYFIIPYFRGSNHFALSYFSGIRFRLKNIIIEGFSYLKTLFLPVFYSLFSPLTLAISLPELAINILSSNSNLRSIHFHYNSVIVSFLFYSLILGYKNFNSFVKNQFIKKLFFILFLIFNIYSIYLYNPLPSPFVKMPVKYEDISPITEKSIKLWQEKLKDENIKVSTTPRLAPFFINRRIFYNFLYDPAFIQSGWTEEQLINETIDKYQKTDYVIIYREEIGQLTKKSLPVTFYLFLKNDPNYQLIYSDNQGEKSLEVYQRR